jgi:hypothetical protein
LDLRTAGNYVCAAHLNCIFKAALALTAIKRELKPLARSRVRMKLPWFANDSGGVYSWVCHTAIGIDEISLVAAAWASGVFGRRMHGIAIGQQEWFQATRAECGTEFTPKIFMKKVGSDLDTCTVISGFPAREKSGAGTVISEVVRVCPPTLFCSAAAVAEFVASVVTAP